MPAKSDLMINRLEFSIEIKADRRSIWNALWEDKNYRDWAAVFAEGSHYLIDNWEEGAKIMFLGPDASGIYSTIESLIPNKEIQFRHIGNVLEGKEQEPDDEVKKWSGTTEKYSLIESKAATTLWVEIDVLNEHLEFMRKKLPEALERIKNKATS